MKGESKSLITRLSREKVQEELAVRFLIDKLFSYRKRLSHLLSLKGNGDRYISAHHLLSDMNHLCDYMRVRKPRRNMTFYARRKITDK